MPAAPAVILSRRYAAVRTKRKIRSESEKQLVKVSFRMTPLRARALEGLAGLTVGGALGGAAAAKTYQSKEPRFWVQGGQVWGRDLSKEERGEIVSRAVKGAAIAGTLLAAGSLVGSAVRRNQISATDLAEGQKAFGHYFASLNQAVKRTSRSARTAPDDASKANAQEMLSRLKSYRSSPRNTADHYMDLAKKRRESALWGGARVQQIQKGDQIIPIPGPSTAEGQMLNELGPGQLSYYLRERGRIGRAASPGPDYWQRRALAGSL